MICQNCSFSNVDDAKFCENCGEKLNMETKEDLDSIAKISDITEERQLISNIVEDNGGNYHWSYEFSLWKNPTTLITIYKILLIGLIIPTSIMFFKFLQDGFINAVKVSFKVIGYGVIGSSVLFLVSYLLVGLIYKGGYYVFFTMNEQGINHIQLAKKLKKSEIIELFTILVGVSSGKQSVAGSGLLAATRSNVYSNFKKVRSIKIDYEKNAIHLKELFKKNQIYVVDGDFAFVKEYIISKCPKNVKVKER